MPFNAEIKNGSIFFQSTKRSAEFQEWKRGHEGCKIVIDEDKPRVSNQIRGYFFGAVIPFLKRLVPSWSSITNEELYEVLKKHFAYFEAHSPVTGRVERYGRSILASDVDKEEGQAFIRDIGEWVMENYGRPLPDPEKYLRWRDSAPLVGEEYAGD